MNQDFAHKTIKGLEGQAAVLPTKSVAEISWGNNGIAYAADGPDEAIKLSGDYAPEDLELDAEDRD